MWFTIEYRCTLYKYTVSSTLRAADILDDIGRAAGGVASTLQILFLLVSVQDGLHHARRAAGGFSLFPLVYS